MKLINLDINLQFILGIGINEICCTINHLEIYFGDKKGAGEKVPRSIVLTPSFSANKYS